MKKCKEWKKRHKELLKRIRRVATDPRLPVLARLLYCLIAADFGLEGRSACCNARLGLRLAKGSAAVSKAFSFLATARLIQRELVGIEYPDQGVIGQEWRTVLPKRRFRFPIEDSVGNATFPRP